jgi:flagellar biosynthesis anti-sigma factor FlgM
MSVKINDLPGRHIQNSGSSSQVASSGKGGKPAQAGPAFAGRDQFSLTSSATQLKALEEQISALPIVDTQRVLGVQRAVATGSFKFEPTVAADNMLNQEKGFAMLDIKKE